MIRQIFDWLASWTPGYWRRKHDALSIKSVATLHIWKRQYRALQCRLWADDLRHDAYAGTLVARIAMYETMLYGTEITAYATAPERRPVRPVRAAAGNPSPGLLPRMQGSQGH